MISNPTEHARRHGSRIAAALLLLVATTLVAGCINNRSERGVEPLWVELDPNTFVTGTTTRHEVLKKLGAPSQLVSLDGGTALYYVLETTVGKGLILFVYNQRKDVTTYTRAVFFFNDDDVLTDFALSEKD